MKLLWTLFLAFVQVGLFSVGGGYAAIPLIQDQIVMRHGLLTMTEFTDLITIAEMTPGPISINSATFVGQRVFGLWGAIICTIAVILPTVILCLILAHIYYKYKKSAGLQSVLGTLRPAVVALIANAGLSIFLLAVFPAGGHVQILELALFIAGLILLRTKKASAIQVIIGSGVVGILIQTLLG